MNMRAIIRLVEAATKLTLPDVIRQVRQQYNADGISDYAIGNGACEDFAFDVLDIWAGPDWRHREGDGFSTVETLNFVVQDERHAAVDWDWPLLRDHWNIAPPAGVDLDRLREIAQICPNHIWITVGHTHYDAESPDGVASFFDLKFFQRYIQRARP